MTSPALAAAAPRAIAARLRHPFPRHRKAFWSELLAESDVFA